MASWQQLKQFVHSNYTVSQDLDATLKLEFLGDNGRTQLVFLGYEALLNGSEGWVTIESPIGKISEIDLQAAVVAAGGIVCGGVGAWTADADLLMLRHAVPLENMDVNEFARPMQLVTVAADAIENALTGEDRF